MQKKIIGILICMLLIISIILPITSTKSAAFYKTEEKTISYIPNQIIIKIHDGVTLDNKQNNGVITTGIDSIDYLNKKTQLNIGLSDHSKDSLVSIVAVSRGVNVIEKHFTLDKTLPGPDHVASLNPEELSNLIEMIRQIPIIIGEDKKIPTEEELKTKQVVQKSLVANKVISQGELFTMENTTIKRPGNGMSPNLFWTLLGREASKDYVANDLIDEKIF